MDHVAAQRQNRSGKIGIARHLERPMDVRVDAPQHEEGDAREQEEEPKDRGGDVDEIVERIGHASLPPGRLSSGPKKKTPKTRIMLRAPSRTSARAGVRNVGLQRVSGREEGVVARRTRRRCGPS